MTPKAVHPSELTSDQKEMARLIDPLIKMIEAALLVYAPSKDRHEVLNFLCTLYSTSISKNLASIITADKKMDYKILDIKQFLHHLCEGVQHGVPVYLAEYKNEEQNVH